MGLDAQIGFRPALIGRQVAILGKPSLNDNSPELQTVVHRLHRCITILRVLVQQLDIMETMTPMDFLDFRDRLRPASGFQSWQFKELEAKLGLKFADRHGKEYYTSQLRPEHISIIKKAESGLSLLELVNKWLERMPLAPAVSDEPVVRLDGVGPDGSEAEVLVFDLA